MSGGKKKWKFRTNVPYWCINKDGTIANENLIFDEDTDRVNFAELMRHEQILIPVKKYGQ